MAYINAVLMACLTGYDELLTIWTVQQHFVGDIYTKDQN